MMASIDMTHVPSERVAVVTASACSFPAKLPQARYFITSPFGDPPPGGGGDEKKEGGPSAGRGCAGVVLKMSISIVVEGANRPQALGQWPANWQNHPGNRAQIA